MEDMSARLKEIQSTLSGRVAGLRFASPVTHVYNPLDYARASVESYLDLAGGGAKKAMFLGMNPGPWGMAQTGVPFGTVSLVRDWMGIDEAVGKPSGEHPKRPVQGFLCEREEVSGARFWGWARDRFGTAERFFDRFFVANYCPLVFMEASGRNRTPDKLPPGERRALFAPCDRALAEVFETLRPEIVIGVGKFAEDRARAVLKGRDVRFGRVLHPSPASPAANRGWREQAEKQLLELGVL